MLHAIVICNDHHQVDSLAAKLQSPASASDGNRCRSAPDASFCAAGSHTFTMTAAETHRNFYHRRNHRDALRIAHHLVGDCFVGSGHNFVQNFGGGIEAFVDIGTVFVICGPRHGGAEQNAGTEHQEKPWQYGINSCHKRTSFVLEASNV